jgi:hypothetical protein
MWFKSLWLHFVWHLWWILTYLDFVVEMHINQSFFMDYTKNVDLGQWNWWHLFQKVPETSTSCQPLGMETTKIQRSLAHVFSVLRISFLFLYIFHCRMCHVQVSWDCLFDHKVIDLAPPAVSLPTTHH